MGTERTTRPQKVAQDPVWQSHMIGLMRQRDCEIRQFFADFFKVKDV